MIALMKAPKSMPFGVPATGMTKPDTVSYTHLAPVHRAVGNTIGNDSTALLISKKLPYYISKYTVGEFRKIFHLAYFLATVRLDLLIGEIKK